MNKLNFMLLCFAQGFGATILLELCDMGINNVGIWWTIFSHIIIQGIICFITVKSGLFDNLIYKE